MIHEVLHGLDVDLIIYGALEIIVFGAIPNL
jgi:hypothetical protein